MAKTREEKELEELIRQQAEWMQKQQSIITEFHPVEKFIADGGLAFLEERVFRVIEKRAFATLKSPDFDPASVSQVAQLKALCQSTDLIRAEINAQAQAVRDARVKLQDLERSTQTGERQGEQ